MRNLIDRLKWDKEFKRKFLSRTGIGAFCLVCVIAIGIVAYGNLVHNDDIDDPFASMHLKHDDSESGNAYKLEFKDYEGKPEEDNHNENQATNEQHNGETGGDQHQGGGQGSGGGQAGHVHHWYVVVDKPAWDETVWIQTGTRYICWNCSFSTTNQSQANAHCRSLGHSCRTEGIMERKTIHHSPVTHQQCDCGARR